MMMVTIFRGPCGWFRVRELAPDSIQAVTVKWTIFYYDAVEFIRETYSSEEVVSSDEFREAYRKRIK